MNVSQTSKGGLGINLQSEHATAITPGATVYKPSIVFVGGAGSVTVTTAGGESGVVFSGLAAGTILPVLVTAVTAATATGIVLLS